MLGMPAPIVLAIGSCRVFRPLHPLHTQGRINLVNDASHQWFLHTAAAARQYINLLTGTTTIPDQLWELAADPDHKKPESMAAPHLLDVDLIIVEVSTVKQHRIDGIELNGHKVHKVAKEAGFNAAQVFNGKTDSVPEGHLLKRLDYSVATFPEITRDLRWIQDTAGVQVMTMNPTYSVTSDGVQLPERQRLTDHLREIEQEYDLPMYDTKPLILEHGLDVALEDRDHYRPKFIPVVGERLYPMIASLTTESCFATV